MLSQMTIGKKLFGGFSAALLLTLIVGGTALWIIGNLGDDIHTLVHVTGQKRLLAAMGDTEASDMIAAARGELLRVLVHDPQAVEQYHQAFLTASSELSQNMSALSAIARTDQEQRDLEQIQAEEHKANRDYEQFRQQVTAGQADQAAAQLKDNIGPDLDQISHLEEQLRQNQTEMMNASVKSTEAQVITGRWITIIMVILSLIVGGVLVYVVRQINNSLRNVITELSEGAGQVASAAGQISASSQTLAQGASEQAASLEETSASSEEINSMARKNAENSQEANTLVTQSQRKFEETNQSLEAMVRAMGEIKESSDKVSKIIKVIDEIAFQTNILALNAAVEAARAGEAGMGFAVVADEVRSLAQRSAQAAKDTASLIEESIAKSNEGRTRVDQVAAAIRAISEESASVKTLVEEVSLGSQEQTRGIEQVAKALTQMEQVTQQAAANAEESAAAAEELTAQASTLMELVHQLKAMVGGAELAETRRAEQHAPARHQAPMAAAKKSLKITRPQTLPVTPTAAHSFPMEEDFKAMV